MKIRLRLRWRPTRKLLVVTGLLVALVVIIALIFLEVRLYGSGFAGKTLWEWLQLLIIPLVLAVGGYLFNFTNSRTERDLTTDNQREVALKEYIDQLSELLLREHLDELKPEYETVRKIARIRTLTVLRRLDPDRKRSVIRYGGPRCQDTKTGSNKSYFPPFRLLFVLNGLRSCLVKNTLRQEFGNQVPGEGAPDYKT